METVDGSDISVLLAGSLRSIREVSVTENPWSKAIRFGDWRLVHYQPEMFEGDTGELYNVRLDPDEAENLYFMPEQREVVEQGRRLLLEWLIRTTRVRTCWPPVVNSPREPFYYAIAGDGNEGNSAGPALRNRQERPSRTYDATVTIGPVTPFARTSRSRFPVRSARRCAELLPFLVYRSRSGSDCVNRRLR